jgi:hypothetical protein
MRLGFLQCGINLLQCRLNLSQRNAASPNRRNGIEIIAIQNRRSSQ